MSLVCVALCCTGVAALAEPEEPEEFEDFESFEDFEDFEDFEEDEKARTLGGWLARNVRVYGYLRSRVYARAPELSNAPSASSFRNELNLVTDVDLFSNPDWEVSFHSVVRPIYEGIYDTQSGLYGEDVDEAEYGTGELFPNNGAANRSRRGRSFPGRGGRLAGEFTILNADLASGFTGKLAPAVAIDDVTFFGLVAAPVNARGGNQPAVGGNASGLTYEALRDNFGTFEGPANGLPPDALDNGGLPPGSGLDASLGMASRDLSTPLNFYAGAGGSRGSFRRSSFDLNRRENELRFDCFDNANPYCMFREFYFDAAYDETFVRFGRQQIVWGKTDFFRLQDVVNPIDLSIHNILPDLDERRIPQLSLDVVQTFGEVGPLEDVSLEGVWIWDRVLPDQFGQCGEPWALSLACQARSDAAGHRLLNVSLAASDAPRWTFGNTQPGARLEFRIPKPEISFSLSAFYGFQKRPVLRFENPYSTENPNAAAMLLLQGIADPDQATPGNPNGSVAALIDQASLASQFFGAPFPHSGNGGPGVWVTGFDPYSRDGRTPTGTLQDANQDLQNAWFLVTQVLTPDSDPGGCAGVPDVPGGLDTCGALISQLALPWAGSEARLRYPRLLTVGGSMDYAIPGIATILRLEMAADIDRAIQNTREADGLSNSTVFKLAVGLDKPFVIPFFRARRPSFISFQTFLEHIVDYKDKRIGGDGMVPVENRMISTLYIQNYFYKDKLGVRNLLAVDWKAGAVLFGPKLRWAWDDHLSFEFGVNMLWGRNRQHNVRDLCPDGRLEGGAGCSFAEPSTWQAGNYQILNAPLDRESQSPFGWQQQSFADRAMRKRDEFWIGATYRF